MYAYYYLWWDTQHWQTTLGPSYPYGQSPLPLPASLATSGCSPTSLYPGNIETDVPATLFTQQTCPDRLRRPERHRRRTVGLRRGLGRDGIGHPDPVVQCRGRAAQHAGRGGRHGPGGRPNFHLWVSYEASATLLPQSSIVGDLTYLTDQYGTNPAFDRSNGGRPRSSGWGPTSTRPRWWRRSVTSSAPTGTSSGGTSGTSGTPRWPQYFDADSPYWSSQDPWNNRPELRAARHPGGHVARGGQEVLRTVGPGFDRQLDGSSGCVPRDNGATLQALYDGNATGDPQGWILISWNEITEGTYVSPELQRYGSAYGGPDGFVHSIITGSPVGSDATAASAGPGCGTQTNQVQAQTFTALAAAVGPGGCAGYWLADSAGQVRAFGGAPGLGSLATPPDAPIVGITATPDHRGYWLLGADGGVFSFGDAQFHGSTGGMHLNQPVIAMTPTADGAGYWLVAKDGGVFSFGDARFHGSTGNLRLNVPIVGMAATSGGSGYWLVGADGGVFAFGAPFLGSMGSVHLDRPVVGITADPSGHGYRMVAADGGIFSFGATFYGSLGGRALSAPIQSMASSLDGHGYYMMGADGALYAFGDAPYLGRVLAS